MNGSGIEQDAAPANETNFSGPVHAWRQAALGWPAFVLLPLAAVCVLSNVLTYCAVSRDQQLRSRKLYAYVTSLAVCDVINAVIVLPLAVAKSFNAADDPPRFTRLADLWYCLDVFLRTVTALHLIGAGLEFCLRLGRTLRRPPDHCTPARRPTVKLVVCWMTSLILAVTPFAWYHCASDASRADTKLRKLVFCVFLLSFMLPLVAATAVMILVMRSWRRAIRAFSKTVVDQTCRYLLNSRDATKAPLSRTASGFSRKGSHRRSGSSMRNRRSARSTGRTSPQLDRHPSLRYSIKRRRSGGSITMDIPVAAAAVRNVSHERKSAIDHVALSERLLDEAAFGQARLSTDSPDCRDGCSVSGAGLLHADRRDSGRSASRKSSSRSSTKSDRCVESPKLDRHPSLRYSTRRKPQGSTATRKSASRVSLEPASVVVAASAADPFSLLTSLQRTHKRLVSQTSFPDAFTWQEQGKRGEGKRGGSFRGMAGGRTADGGSGEDMTLIAAVSRAHKFSQKRSSSTRRSGSRREAKLQIAPESPRLDRHPSLRYSTKRQSHPPALAKKGDGGFKQFQKNTSTLSIGHGQINGLKASDEQGFLGDHPSRKGGSNLSIVRAYIDTLQLQKTSTSPVGSTLSIGTCHDLLIQPSTSSYSVKDKHLLNGESTQRVSRLQHGDRADFAAEFLRTACVQDGESMVNRLRVAHSDRDMSGAGGSSTMQRLGSFKQPDDRRSLTEDKAPAAFAASGSHRGSKKSFTRDTSHHVEDWLSLESRSRPKREAGAAAGDSVHRASPNNTLTTDMSSLRHVVRQTPNGSDDRLVTFRIAESIDLHLLIALFVIFIVFNVPWMVTNVIAVFCRNCRQTVTNVGTAMISVPSYTILSASVFFTLQTMSYLASLLRPAIFYLLSQRFQVACVNLCS